MRGVYHYLRGGNATIGARAGLVCNVFARIAGDTPRWVTPSMSISEPRASRRRYCA